MICWLKSLLASSTLGQADANQEHAEDDKPAKPSRLNSSIGNTPIRKIGSSGNTSNELDCERIGRLSVAANDGLYAD